MDNIEPVYMYQAFEDLAEQPPNFLSLFVNISGYQISQCLDTSALASFHSSSEERPGSKDAELLLTRFSQYSMDI